MKQKYPVNKEFFPYYLFAAPINRPVIRLSQKLMKVPGFLYKDPELEVVIRKIPAWQNGEIELIVLSPKDGKKNRPCLINMHGGGFVFEGWNSHFRHAMQYAKSTGCTVVYVRYRLAPDYPFPYPQEDCYAALIWIWEHAEELGIDPDRIGLSGDSAGGALTVTSCLLARDRGAEVRPIFQMLIYPWLDDRNNSDSARRYTDTPLWNSTMSRKVAPIINPYPEKIPRFLHSPVEAESLQGLPPAYIEVAEFDCLHDDGILYAKRLKETGIPVELYETRGTIHGFDNKVTAPTTRKVVRQRIAYMKRMFW